MYLVKNNIKYFINIQPVDGWDEWHVEILMEDIMSPFVVIYKSHPENPYSTYDEALIFSMQYVSCY